LSTLGPKQDLQGISRGKRLTGLEVKKKEPFLTLNEFFQISTIYFAVDPGGVRLTLATITAANRNKSVGNMICVS